MLKENKAKRYLEKHGLMKYLQGETKEQLEPEYSKLARLHRLAVKRKASTILEFGVGWSTIILAHASQLTNGKVFSIDDSKHWINNARNLFPSGLKKYVKFHYSEVEAGKFNGRICHFYKTLPDIVPDFIYLDGPSTSSIKGNIHGLSWKKRSVMSGDILLMEPTFYSRTFIVVDRRLNNAQFLKNNLQRNWIIRHYTSTPTFKLAEISLIKRVLKKIKKLL